MQAPFVILTGASGVGKTTLALAIEKSHPEIAVFRFDTIGVPSAEVMSTFGTGHKPGGAWQRAMTFHWLERIAPLLREGRPVLLEGQMRLAFIQEAIATQAIPHAQIILVECSDALRDARLIHEREQPELANESMAAWSHYLHQEALDLNISILNTGAIAIDDSIRYVVSLLTDKRLQHVS